jgi:hypothetical protein
MFRLIVLVMPIAIGMKVPMDMEPSREADLIAPTDERIVPTLSAAQYNDPPVLATEARLTDRLTELLVTLRIVMKLTLGINVTTVGEDVGDRDGDEAVDTL